MTDQYLPPAPDHHDTAAYARPLPPAGQGYATQGPGTTGSGWQTPSQPLGVNPEADYWAARYRSQRTWTRALAVGVAVALVGVLGIGAAVLRADSPSELAAVDQSQAQSSPDDTIPPNDTLPDESAPQGTLPEGTVPDGTVPDGTVPDGTVPEGSQPQDGSTPEGSTPEGAGPGSSDVPLSELPLPESVQDLAAFLGITDVGQILDLAVANGMMSQEDADRLRAAITVGAAIPGLLGQDQTQDGTAQDPAQL